MKAKALLVLGLPLALVIVAKRSKPAGFWEREWDRLKKPPPHEPFPWENPLPWSK